MAMINPPSGLSLWTSSEEVNCALDINKPFCVLRTVAFKDDGECSFYFNNTAFVINLFEYYKKLLPSILILSFMYEGVSTLLWRSETQT